MEHAGTPRHHKADLIRSVALFQGCNDAEVARICSMTTEHWARAGEVLTKQGEPGLDGFVIVEGQVTATRSGRRIAHLGPGTLFGELALLDGNKRTATVVAETDLILLVLSRRDFINLLDTAPSVARKVMAELGARLRRTDDLIDPLAERGGEVPPLSV